MRVRERGLYAATDEELYELAILEQRVLVSVDTDFALLIATRRARMPSLIRFRRDWHIPARQVSAILNNVARIETALQQGAIVTFDRERIRIRELPILD